VAEVPPAETTTAQEDQPDELPLAVRPFTGEFGTIRTVEVDAKTWFVAKDVAEALDYAWQPNLISHVPDQWKRLNRVNTPNSGGSQSVLTLSDQGVYFFLGRSDKPKALPFQLWLAGEVVPAIQRHGTYMTDQFIENALDDPDTAIRLLQEVKLARALTRAAEAARIAAAKTGDGPELAVPIVG